MERQFRIIWVEDDNWQLERAILRKLGYEVEWLRDASASDSWIDAVQDDSDYVSSIAIVLVDLMLSAGHSNKYEVDSSTLGVEIARKIVDKLGCSSRVRIVSITANPEYKKTASNFSKSVGCIFVEKTKIYRGKRFIDWIQGEISNGN